MTTTGTTAPSIYLIDGSFACGVCVSAEIRSALDADLVEPRNLAGSLRPVTACCGACIRVDRATHEVYAVTPEC